MTRQGNIRVTQAGLKGGQAIELEYAGDDLSPELAARFPHLRTAVMLKIPTERLAQVPDILRGQFAVTVSGPDGADSGRNRGADPGCAGRSVRQ
jgi:pullulanase